MYVYKFVQHLPKLALSNRLFLFTFYTFRFQMILSNVQQTKIQMSTFQYTQHDIQIEIKHVQHYELLVAVIPFQIPTAATFKF